jgi:hypothetical protein
VTRVLCRRDFEGLLEPHARIFLLGLAQHVRDQRGQCADILLVQRKHIRPFDGWHIVDIRRVELSALDGFDGHASARRVETEELARFILYFEQGPALDGFVGARGESAKVRAAQKADGSLHMLDPPEGVERRPQLVRVFDLSQQIAQKRIRDGGKCFGGGEAVKSRHFHSVHGLRGFHGVARIYFKKSVFIRVISEIRVPHLPITSRQLLVELNMLRRRVLELGQRTAEDQLHTADRSIAVLGDDDLGDVLLGRIFFVLIGTIDEHDDVAILL